MNRRRFLLTSGLSIAGLAAAGYLLTDRSNLSRSDLPEALGNTLNLHPDERRILQLASLAPSGHNTQPWIVRRLAPFQFIIGNDAARWLPAVDPAQRETMLSLGAFVQNLEYAAAGLGYACVWKLLATRLQDEDVVEVRLVPAGVGGYPDERMELRRTLRSGYEPTGIRKEDLRYITANDPQRFVFIGPEEPLYARLNEWTIEANREQTFRDAAQSELADWMRFSNADAERYRDGLTSASMELDGIAGWYVRSFYQRKDALATGFREQGLKKVVEQVGRSGGWLLILSKGDTPAELLEAGRVLQRMLLLTRERGIAVHPMTQVLEEATYHQALHRALGTSSLVQFVLRIGYVRHYPNPVSLRRPVEWFVRVGSGRE